MNYIEEVLVFVINLSGFWLAYWVYNTDRREKLNQWFTVMTFFVVMWVDFAFLGYWTRDVYLATLFYRLNSTFVSLFLVSLYYFFILYFFEEKNKHIFLERLVSMAGIAFAIISLSTDLLVKDTIIQSWGAEIVFGKGDSLFFLYSLFVSFLIIYFSLGKYLHLSKIRQFKVQYFSVGIFFFILFNIVFNIVFPALTGSVEYAHYGDYSAIILVAFTAYAITKNNLMGVRTLLAQAIIIAMSILLFVDIFFLSNSLVMQALKTGVLVTFLYYSNELIKSVKREKGILEKMERANLNLAERNKDLHILFEASSKVSQDLDSRKISQDVVNSIPKNLKYLGYNSGVIVLYSTKKDCVYVYAVTDSQLTRKVEKAAKVNVRKFREHLSEHEDLMVKTIKNKKIYVSGDMEDFYGGFMEREQNEIAQKILKAKSFISVPLFSSGQVIGAIIFSNGKKPDDITERSQDILRAFASHIGSAIENAQLYEKTNRQMSELGALNRNLKRANVRLNELLEMKNEFLHITSHQLRTPLTSIRGMISMWIDGDFEKLPKAQKAEMLRRIYVSTERLNNVTNDMLDALELEGGVMKLEFKQVAVLEMIKDTIATLQSDYDKKGLYLRMGEVDAELPEIEAEPNYIAQIFMNIIDNSCKYTKTGGTKIDIKKAGKYINVIIKDTGIGMERKEISRAFEKFTRGKNAMKENASGSGLGLFIAKKVLDEHGGKIVIKSDGPGTGTTFRISLLIKQE